MRWIDNVFAEGLRKRLHSAWEASTFFVQEMHAFENFLEKFLITKMEVPDDADYTHPEFDVGSDRVIKLIGLMEKCPRPAQEKEKGKCRKRKEPADEARGEKKFRSRCDTDPVYLNHLRMFVTERNHKVDFPTELTKEGNGRSKQQIIKLLSTGACAPKRLQWRVNLPRSLEARTMLRQSGDDISRKFQTIQ